MIVVISKGITPTDKVLQNSLLKKQRLRKNFMLTWQAMKTKMTLLNPQLEVFVAVAKYKSMHAAARAIHLTQTAITQRIRALETRLHTTLFIRTSQGVQLTPDGEALLRYCHATLDLEGETLAKINGAGLEYPVRICITGPTSIMATRIIPLCLTVMNKFPQLLITFDVNDSEQRMGALQRGISQFSIVEPEHVLKEMEIKKLKPEKYVLVCSSRWKNRKFQDIIQSERIIDFDESDPMTMNYLKHFNLFNSVKLERHFVNRTESLAKMFIDGYGYGVLTTEFSKPYIENNQLIMLNSGKTYVNQLVLTWYTRPEPPTYFSDIINIIN